MNYYINPSMLTSAFTVPTVVTDRYLKFAKAEHIKVLLYMLRNMFEEITVEKIAESTGVSEYDINEALLYWADTGVLLPKETTNTKQEKENKSVVQKAEKPTRNDVARRGNEDEKIRYLLMEAQQKFGRNLKTNETSTLVWLYDDEGLDVSLILMIIQYAVAHNKANIRFIESTAVDWINKGVDSIALADEELRKMSLGEQAWKIVCSAFGLESRKPSKKETELATLWIDEWNLSKEDLVEAYEECVNAKSKFSFAYTAKIIENWHKDGKNQKQKQKENKKDDFAAYDLDLFEKMLNSKE